jgi:hypothetical protein
MKNSLELTDQWINCFSTTAIQQQRGLPNSGDMNVMQKMIEET